MEKFAKKLAIDYKVEVDSDGNYFPMKFLNENFSIIRSAYEILSESIAQNVPIPPGGEWLLDNFYIIEEQVSAINGSLSFKKYIKLPSIEKLARVYFLSRELVNYTDGVVTKEGVEKFFNAYETRRALLQKEIYEIPTMLQIALIEHIKNVAQKIIIGQLQKFKVESLVERTVKNKGVSKERFHKYKSVNLYNEATSYVEYLTYLLRRLGKEGKPYLDILEDEIIKVRYDIKRNN